MEIKIILTIYLIGAGIWTYIINRMINRKFCYFYEKEIEEKFGSNPDESISEGFRIGIYICAILAIIMWPIFTILLTIRHIIMKIVDYKEKKQIRLQLKNAEELGEIATIVIDCGKTKFEYDGENKQILFLNITTMDKDPDCYSAAAIKTSPEITNIVQDRLRGQDSEFELKKDKSYQFKVVVLSNDKCYRGYITIKGV